MSTRSIIARIDGDKVRSIYCHWDGYPSHNGCKLVKYYNKDRSVDRLLSLGSLSVLGKVVGKKHNFDEYSKVYEKSGREVAQKLIQHRRDWCVSYGRDRGEENVEVQEFDSFEDFNESLKDSWTEWVYLWKNGAWHFYPTREPEKIQKFTKKNFIKYEKERIEDIGYEEYIRENIIRGCKIAEWKVPG